MINLVICDDDKNFCEMLKGKLENTMKKQQFEYNINCIFTYDELINYDEQINILFLDVMLNGENAIEKLIESGKSNLPYELVIITSYPGEISMISELDPRYYLDKNKMKDESINNALRKCITSLTNKDRNKIILDINKASVTVDMKNITYFEAQNKITILYFKDGKKLDANVKISELMKKVGPNFQQCSKSYSVNFDYIVSYKWHKYVLNNGVEINISRDKYREYTSQYKKYLEY